MKIFLLKLRGKWRLFWGFCPKCNSDAPEVYDCTVCKWYRSSYGGMANKVVKKLWWKRYLTYIASLNLKNHDII